MLSAFLTIAMVASASFNSTDDPALRINIFPMPSSIAQRSGEFHFARPTVIEAGNDCRNEARALSDMIAAGVGRAVIAPPGGPNENAISLALDSHLTDLGDEGYALSITPDRIEVRALKSAGIFYGVQTIRQMLPKEIEDPATAAHARWAVPCAEIRDKPKFGWRGLLLDVSRHFFTKAEIERFLDFLAMQKMNVFHWHLVDDGGWRIEIKKYPLLTQRGAWRKWYPELWNQQHLSFPGTSTDQRLYGGYYTQDDIREVVRYAEARHITVMPEIEMPGHSLAAMASYPELICTNAPIEEFAKRGTPFPNVYCAGKESTFKFIEGVLDEVMELFPSEYIHIGGDEVDKFLWEHCPDCQRRMQEEGLKTPEELQSYFIRRVEKYLNSKGRRLLGWDEILEGGLAPNASVMSWRGIDGGIAAAKAGHDVVMTPTSHCYFDYSYANISTEHVLGFDPVPSGLDADQAKHILGPQCNLWTEMVPDMATAEERLFPRMVSLAEVGWSEKRETDPEAFMARLEPFLGRLDLLHVNFYVPTPHAEYDAVLLNGEGQVAFTKPPAGSVIRYTTDGTLPTEKSPVYRDPIRVNRPMTVTAVRYMGPAHSDPTSVSVAAYSPVNPAGLQPGLNWKLAEGQWSLAPDFDRLPTAASGVSDQVCLVGDRKVNYGIQYSGYLKIEKEGIYKLYVASDDGSDLWLGPARVVDNDGLHGEIEKSGRIYLRSGFYPFKTRFFQAGGAQALSASIEGPGLSKTPIPAALLFH